MSDVFISYARSTAAQARLVAERLRALGYEVWRDDDLPPHRAYEEVISERLASAKVVVVIWSADAAQSQWVRSEANRGRADGKLVQLSLDGAGLPMPFDQIQCADLTGWTGDADAPGWRKVVDSIAALAGGAEPSPSAASRSVRKVSICVLPFANMSGDVDQEYFSDGISEDIITDLSKVSALSVVARNTAFTFKGKAIDVPRVAHQLNVGHVLEGSVRKAGTRVRITAQLIDGAAGDHVWAERWDRDLTDIFALQDEISEAIVGAVRLRLLPEEKKAIERRGTTKPDAYNLYLMARQQYVSGNQGDSRREEAIIRLCRRATEIDPGYARPWALMALAQTSLHFRYGKPGDNGLAAAERALVLEPDLAEPHAVKARHLREQGQDDEAFAEIQIALGLDPESYEVNLGAGYVSFRQRRFEDAIRYYEKAAAAMEGDFTSAGTLHSCYAAIGDGEGARRAARMTLARAEAAVAQDKSNGSAMGFAVVALAVLGEAERAREWIDRALLIDPDNLNMRYNFACALCVHLGDTDTALDLLGPLFATTTPTWLNHIKADPDLDIIRKDPRFESMVAAAEARLTAADAANAASGEFSPPGGPQE
ncbi:MAG: TIR domain-containing protein [Pseudomonadota bacterium]|nr:TIR domain-containing protein [Pseudomonadota bacterium]